MTFPSQWNRPITVPATKGWKAAISSLFLLLLAGLPAFGQGKPIDNPVAPSNILNLPPGELPTGFSVQLEPPGPERLFRVESEEALRERMRQEKRNSPKMDRLVFPEEVVLSNSIYDPNWRAANWKPMVRQVEPNYLVHGRLLFHEKNSERYGWDLGPVQPFVSGAYFLADMALLPYHLATDPLRRFESNAGYCLPGDQVPYMLYPIGASATGSVAEAAAVFALIACFP